MIKWKNKFCAFRKPVCFGWTNKVRIFSFVHWSCIHQEYKRKLNWPELDLLRWLVGVSHIKSYLAWENNSTQFRSIGFAHYVQWHRAHRKIIHSFATKHSDLYRLTVDRISCTTNEYEFYILFLFIFAFCTMAFADNYICLFVADAPNNTNRQIESRK